MRYIYLFLALGIFCSCHKKATGDQNCTKYEVVPATAVDSVDATHLKVSFMVNNGCGHFYKFLEKDSAGITYVRIMAKYTGCMCTMDLPVREEVYTIKNNKKVQFYK